MNTLLFLTLIVLFSAVLVLVYLYFNRQLTYEKSQKQHAFTEYDILQKQQNFFIKKMVHEMNTPLTAIELNISVLQRECPNLKNVEMIKGSARILSGIYDDIAFISRKETKDYPREWIDLEEFIADRILYFHAMTTIKKIIIEIKTDGGCAVLMSHTELQRLVDNNLSNAIKYTKKNNQVITVIISYQADTLSLTFKDNGIGMSEQEQKDLFETYYQVNTNHQGLGLGMSIIKEICDDYNISIEIQSMKERGSSFIYKIPQEIVRKTGGTE